MDTIANRRGRRSDTLAKWEDIYSTAGFDAVKGMFLEAFGPQLDWNVLKPEDGVAAIRADLPEHCGIDYLDFSPPAFWESPYVLQLATLAPGPRADFVSHSGEEIVTPIDGKLRFHFFWTKGKTRPTEHTGDFAYGDIIRLNPEVPHHAWGIKKAAKAWLILRASTDVEPAVSLSSKRANTEDESTGARPKLWTRKDLEQPGRYALTAWGIAAKIKHHRERAHLKIKDVAERCGIDQTHLSKLESAETNISIDVLFRIAEYLKLDLGEFFSVPPWPFLRDPVSKHAPEDPEVQHQPVVRPQAQHFLHVSTLSIPANDVDELAIARLAPQNALASWIVIAGKGIFSNDTSEEILRAGSVLHMRGRRKGSFRTLEPTVLVQVLYSSVCTCGPAADAPHAKRSLL